VVLGWFVKHGESVEESKGFGVFSNVENIYQGVLIYGN
jgi:hypothetical protein